MHVFSVARVKDCGAVDLFVARISVTKWSTVIFWVEAMLIHYVGLIKFRRYLSKGN